MSIKYISYCKKYLFLLGIVLPLKLMAMPPWEVVDACMGSVSMIHGIIFTEMKNPSGKDFSEGGPIFENECYADMEIIYKDIHYGRSECHGDASVFINGHNLSLDEAKNFSINPYIGPGSPISFHARWWKIGYRKKTYLCIEQTLSDSGDGAAREQYYIIENVMPFDIPILYYYLFETDVMPLTMSWPEQEEIKKEFPFFKFSPDKNEEYR